MIKFLATKDGKPLYGFGLSCENCERLMRGQPILIDLDVMCADAKDHNASQRGAVIIFGGATEDEMTRQLSEYVELPTGDDVKTHRDDEAQAKRTKRFPPTYGARP